MLPQDNGEVWVGLKWPHRALTASAWHTAYPLVETFQAHLHEDVEEWLIDHYPSVKFRWSYPSKLYFIQFRSYEDAFAFKMRWG